jgi:hypothetical protein
VDARPSREPGHPRDPIAMIVAHHYPWISGTRGWRSLPNRSCSSSRESMRDSAGPGAARPLGDALPAVGPRARIRWCRYCAPSLGDADQMPSWHLIRSHPETRDSRNASPIPPNPAIAQTLRLIASSQTLSTAGGKSLWHPAHPPRVPTRPDRCCLPNLEVSRPRWSVPHLSRAERFLGPRAGTTVRFKHAHYFSIARRGSLYRTAPSRLRR